MDIRTIYCPICDKHIWLETKDIMAKCPFCNHHLNTKEN